MLSIIFLDIDGVLRPGKNENPSVLDPEAVNRLNRITKATGAFIVLSSGWRLPYVQLGIIQKMRDDLAAHGIEAPVLGATPDTEGNRASQINDWLYAHMRDHVGSFIILDDLSDMGDLTSRLVRTTFDDGLQDCHVEQAIALLVRV